jgi:beta-glucosidase
MMIRATCSFPPGFLWGTASASHQVEGDNTNNDWWDWEQQPGRIRNGDRSGRACEWWAGRWAEDFDRAAETGQKAHRLSVEWSRIEPSPAMWDESALDAYRQILRGALDRGMMPMVTLHHFSSPRWLAEQGGWLADDIVPRFERFTRKVVAALGDLTGLWVTINEPFVFAYLGYAGSDFPPGARSMPKMVQALRNIALAHAAAYRAIHELQPGALVGLAHQYRGFLPAHPGGPLDALVARLRHSLFNETVPRAVADGRFRMLGRTERLTGVAGTQDFFGLNYYTVERCAFDLRRPGDLFTRGFYPPEADLSPTGFIANEPDGFSRAMQWARGFKLPIYITENGVEDAQDRMRPRYLAAHVHRVWKAVNIGTPIRGYFHWSLVDNFEWERGWSNRFGLWGLDTETQARHRRPSVDFYAEICGSNALSSEMVGRYAPEALERLFPSRGPEGLDIQRG